MNIVSCMAHYFLDPKTVLLEFQYLWCRWTKKKPTGTLLVQCKRLPLFLINLFYEPAFIEMRKWSHRRRWGLHMESGSHFPMATDGAFLKAHSQERMTTRKGVPLRQAEKSLRISLTIFVDVAGCGVRNRQNVPVHWPYPQRRGARQSQVSSATGGRAGRTAEEIHISEQTTQINAPRRQWRLNAV